MGDAATSGCPNCRRLEARIDVLEARTLRFVVFDRRMTQGTRGEAGRQWCEQFWTVRATCAQQGRSVFDSLHAALTAHFAGQPAPSLLPA